MLSYRNFPKIAILNSSNHKLQPLVLIGILDWGLGHASRMIPLIRYLLQTQCQIMLAASGQQKKLLQLEFPQLTFIEPPEYDVKYKPFAGNLVFGLMGQVPRLLRVIRDEELWVNKICREHNVNAIISDNRYGFYSKEVPTAFITHQVAPLTGLGRIPDHIFKLLHLSRLRRFTECWIPDTMDSSLSGLLSSPGRSLGNARFIGPISRFEGRATPPAGKKHLLVLLSGPEPSRSTFEAMVVHQLSTYTGPYTILRGLPGGGRDPIPNGIDHLDAEALARLIENSDLIVCRAGYTTIMDLVAMKRTALLVPTPGQTEQEYLAAHLSRGGYFITAKEKDLDLKAEVVRLRNFAPATLEPGLTGYKLALDQFLFKINERL